MHFKFQGNKALLGFLILAVLSALLISCTEKTSRIETDIFGKGPVRYPWMKVYMLQPDSYLAACRWDNGKAQSPSILLALRTYYHVSRGCRKGSTCRSGSIRFRLRTTNRSTTLWSISRKLLFNFYNTIESFPVRCSSILAGRLLRSGRQFIAEMEWKYVNSGLKDDAVVWDRLALKEPKFPLRRASSDNI